MVSVFFFFFFSCNPFPESKASKLSAMLFSVCQFLFGERQVNGLRPAHSHIGSFAHPDLHGVPHATSHLPKHVKWRSICSSKVEKSHHVVGSVKSLSAKLKHWADISLGHSLRSYHHTRPMKVKVVKWCRKKWNEHNLMTIYHKQCEIKQKIQWNSSNGQLQPFMLIIASLMDASTFIFLSDNRMDS